MDFRSAHIVVAGHICLDIIPTFPDAFQDFSQAFAPGQLINVGPAVTATGGVVSNTGIALHRLGTNVTLVGKIGDDFIGDTIISELNKIDPSLSENMVVAEGEHSSYSIVINPPETDRIFLHNPGANHTFCSEDIVDKAIKAAQLFHFGYPPLMKKMYQHEGRELKSIFSRVKKTGLTSSLDMTLPDPKSESGQVNWHNILENVLPYVDIFSPSLDEISFMLMPDTYEAGIHGEKPDIKLLSSLTDQILKMGAAIAVIKLGSFGLYVRTTPNPDRWSRFGTCKPENIEPWLDRELFAPTFSVDVIGTTGAGDCTIAGFLSGLLNNMNPEDCMTVAVAAGACNVEKADATSGIPSWEKLVKRISGDWKRNEVSLSQPGWYYDAEKEIWIGSDDKKSLKNREVSSC